MKHDKKNLALMDKIIGVIDQSDEWQEILMHDPMITAAENRWETAIEKAKAFLPEELYEELYNSYESNTSIFGDAGILFGIHVADIIRDVASRPADLSQYVMERIKGRATA